MCRNTLVQIFCRFLLTLLGPGPVASALYDDKFEFDNDDDDDDDDSDDKEDNYGDKYDVEDRVDDCRVAFEDDTNTTLQNTASVLSDI